MRNKEGYKVIYLTVYRIKLDCYKVARADLEGKGASATFKSFAYNYYVIATINSMKISFNDA